MVEISIPVIDPVITPVVEPEVAAPPARTKQYGVKAAKAVNAAHIQELGFPTPLEFLVHLYSDENIPRSERLDAAKAAAPYVHAKLNAIDVNANISISHEDAILLLDDDDD